MLKLDHLVFAVSDLENGIEWVESLLGIAATPGGPHPQWATRNALISLGRDCFMEIIGPDPDQPAPTWPRIFRIDSVTSPTLVTWAMKGKLDDFAAKARAGGVPFGETIAGSRVRPDGVVLSWLVTDPRVTIADGIVPFVIDWGNTPHPAQAAAPGATLVGLRAEHPDAERVREMLAVLGLELPVRRSDRARLIATIDCPRGRIELP